MFLTLLKHPLKADPATQSGIYETLGRIHTQLGNLKQAEDLLHVGLAKAKAALGPDNAQTSAAFTQLGILKRDEGQTKEGLDLVREGVAVAERVSPPNKTLVTDARSSLARVLAQSGEYGKAIAILEPIVQQPPPGEEGKIIYLESLTALAFAEQSAGRLADAETHHRLALKIDGEQNGPGHPRVATDLANIATIAMSRGNFAEAERLYREAAEIMSAWYSRTHPSVVQLESFIARALINQEKDAQAAVTCLENFSHS